MEENFQNHIPLLGQLLCCWVEVTLGVWAPGLWAALSLPGLCGEGEHHPWEGKVPAGGPNSVADTLVRKWSYHWPHASFSSFSVPGPWEPNQMWVWLAVSGPHWGTDIAYFEEEEAEIQERPLYHLSASPSSQRLIHFPQYCFNNLLIGFLTLVWP